jgi:hypothetical protein
LLTAVETRSPPTVASIARQIVRRLAEKSRVDPRQLERELRLADRDLPVDAAQMRSILGELERDFGVRLGSGPSLASSLDYVLEMAILIQRLLMVKHARVS